MGQLSRVPLFSQLLLGPFHSPSSCFTMWGLKSGTGSLRVGGDGPGSSLRTGIWGGFYGGEACTCSGSGRMRGPPFPRGQRKSQDREQSEHLHTTSCSHPQEGAPGGSSTPRSCVQGGNDFGHCLWWLPVLAWLLVPITIH